MKRNIYDEIYWTKEQQEDYLLGVRSNELLGCPFCGQRPDSEERISLGSKKGEWRIGCRCMGAYCVEETKGKAYQKWNRRAT